jgi:hypothetical protein
VPADRPRNLTTRPPKKDAASVPSAQVLTFPRATLPNASNDAKSGDRDDYGEGRQAPHHVIGATAIAIIPPRIEEPIHRLSTLAGDNSSENELETAGDIFPAFDREHLERIEGASASASEICAALQAWCAKRDFKVPSQKRLGLYLARLGFEKWKSNGKMRYQHVRLKVVRDIAITGQPPCPFERIRCPVRCLMRRCGHVPRSPASVDDPQVSTLFLRPATPHRHRAFSFSALRI